MMEDSTNDVWFVYDGDCPVCQIAANGLKIQKAVGTLNLLDARKDKDHPILQEINNKGFDLDQGMVIKFKDVYYHGADALNIMAMLGTNRGWFNRMNYLLFRSKLFANVCYPLMRAMRNMAIKYKGVSKINNLRDSKQPTLKPIFGDLWDKIPEVIRSRYANTPYSNDRITAEGTIDISYSPLIKLFLPLLRLFGALPPHTGHNIPVTVHFYSEPHSNAFCFDRIINFPAKGTHHFRSRMIPHKNNTLIEYIRFGIGLKLKYEYDNKDTVSLKYQGYVWNIAGILIPLPLAILFGKTFAEETAVSENVFNVRVGAQHFLWGTTFEYSGPFKITRTHLHTAKN